MLERAVMLAGVSDVVRLDVEPSQMLIYADEGLVEQVAVNLLKNAREAAEGLSDGRIEVVARISADETVRIDFGDNGAAIPAEVSDNIFTPFFTTRSAGDGTGLGLYLVKEIVDQHRGCLLVDESELQQRRQKEEALGALAFRARGRQRQISPALKAYALFAASADKGAVRILPE